MKYFIVPEQQELQIAIEQSIREKAWLIVPYSVNISQVIEKSCDMGFSNELKVCYWDEYNFTSQSPCVFIYADDILSEIMGRKNNKNDTTVISLEVNNDSFRKRN